jgi:actin related protein 2/3 complex subunit 1A/1B
MQRKEKTTICEAGIVGLCFNADKSRAAFSPNSHLIYIADCSKALKDCTQWDILETLEQHDQAVTCLAWQPVTGKLLSCSQDRTAFVWDRNPQSGKWDPSLVMLEAAVKRGLTACAWSAAGSKIYVAGAWKNFGVGYYDASNAWWYCKPVEQHESSVTCVAPHPTNNSIVATGSTDCTVRIISTYVKAVDGKTSELPKLGTLLSNCAVGAWVNAVQWSPDATSLAIATHDARIHVYAGSYANCQDFALRTTISLKGLPVRSLAFLSNDMFVAAGYDFFPFLLDRAAASGPWVIAGKWTADNELKKEKSAAELARLKFQNQASTGQSEAVEVAKTKHKNVIVSVVPFTAAATKDDLKALLFATGSMDGRVECWSFDDIVAP